MDRLTRGLCPLAVAGTLAGCAHTAQATRAPVRRTCDDVVAATDSQIAARIYGQLTTGRDVAGAVARVTRSSALAAAVAHDDAAATRTALRPLLHAQVQRLVVTRGTRTLAVVGRRSAIARVSGTIRAADGRAVGSFQLSRTTAPALAALIAHLTATQVSIHSGGALLGRAGSAPADIGERVIVPGTGSLQMQLTTARTGIPSCTTAAVIGTVGERLFRQEQTSTKTQRVLRIVTRDPGFERAVAEDRPALLRARIVHFFRAPSLHVVRIRAVTADGRLVNDVGGPYVLAPASAPVRRHGRVVGTATLSIQDDTGYIKLMRRFTGAATILRAGGTAVPGSARPSHRQGVTFQVTRFPTGPLTVTLTPATGSRSQ